MWLPVPFTSHQNWGNEKDWVLQFTIPFIVLSRKGGRKHQIWHNSLFQLPCLKFPPYILYSEIRKWKSISTSLLCDKQTPCISHSWSWQSNHCYVDIKIHSAPSLWWNGITYYRKISNDLSILPLNGPCTATDKEYSSSFKASGTLLEPHRLGPHLFISPIY